jgi:hypothetical protein
VIGNLEFRALIEKLTPFDIGILVAAAVMALGAFCPLVSIPIVGSLNYMMGGRGDGIIIVGCSGAIIALVVTGYRRMSAIFAAGALIMMVVTLARFAEALSKAQHELLKPTTGPNPFGGLAKLMANSVGLQWGWVLLFGGALGVLVLALMAPRADVSEGAQPAKSEEEKAFSSADKIIADYLENRKISPAIRDQSMPQQTGFGKRRAF